MANYGFQSWRQISTNHKISQQSDLKEIHPPQSDSHRKHCLVCPLCPAQSKWELKLWAVVSLWLFHTVCVRCTGPHFRHLCHPAPAGCSSIPPRGLLGIFLLDRFLDPSVKLFEAYGGFTISSAAQLVGPSSTNWKGHVEGNMIGQARRHRWNTVLYSKSIVLYIDVYCRWF